MDQKLTRQLMRGIGAEEKNQPLASSPEKKKRPSPQKLASQWQERERMKAPKKGSSPGGEGSSRSRFDVSGSRRIDGTTSSPSVGQPGPIASRSPAQTRNPARAGSSQVSGGSQASQGRGEEAQSEWRGQMAAVAPGLGEVPVESQQAGSDSSQEAPAAGGGGTARVEEEGDVEGEDLAGYEATKSPLWVKGVHFCAVFLLVTVLGLSAFNPCADNVAWVAVRLENLSGGLGASAADICSSASAHLWVNACAATRGLWEPKTRPLRAIRSPLTGRMSSAPVPEMHPQLWGALVAASQKLSPAGRASAKAITAAWSSTSSVAHSVWAAVSRSGLKSPWSGRFASGPAGSASQELEDWEAKVKSSVVVLQGDRKAVPVEATQPAKEEALLEAAIEASTVAAAVARAKEQLEVSLDGDQKEEEEKPKAAAVANLYKSLREKLGPSAALQLQSQAVQLENSSLEDPGTALIPEAPVSFLTQATPVALALTLLLVLASACLGRRLGEPKGASQTAGQPPAGGATSTPEDVAGSQEGGAGDQIMPPPATPPPESITPAPEGSAPEAPTQAAVGPATLLAAGALSSGNLGTTSNSNSTSDSHGNSFGKSVPMFVTPQRRRAGHAAREDSAHSHRTGSVCMAGSGDNSEGESSSSNLIIKGDVMMMQSTLSSTPAYGSLSAYKAAKEKEGLGNLTPVRRSARLLNKASHSPLPSPFLVQ